MSTLHQSRRRRRPAALVEEPSPDRCRVTISLICVGLLLQPIWSKAPRSTLPVLTFGRITLIVATLALLAELLHRRRLPLQPPLPGLLLIAGLICGLAVVGASAVQHGTIHSQGAFYGYAEFVAVVILLVLVASRDEGSWLPLLLAAAGGSLASDAQALVTGLANASTARLSGEFGNPNYLAYATATGTAILLGAQLVARAWWRAVGLVILALPLTVLALTYSRTGAVILAVSIVVLAAQTPTTHRFAAAAAVALLLSGGAVLTYPLFQRLRTQSDYPAKADRSGWDPAAQGPIGSGPSKLSNTSAGELRVVANARGSGVSHPIGAVRAGERVAVTLTAISTLSRLPFHFALEDNIRGNGLRQKFAHLSPVPRRLTVRWRPRATSPDARVYFWSQSPHVEFAISRIAITKRRGHPGSRAGPLVSHLGTRLAGSTEIPTAKGFERRAVDSRSAAASFAIHLFVHHPLFGVGWERFNAYAVRRLGVYDPGSVHDQFLTIAAELGIPGVLCVLLCGVGLVLRIRRGDFTRTQLASAAPLTGALAGLFLIDAVVTPAVVLPLAATVAVLFAEGRSPVGGRA